ncbi:MAG TPA: hypothetical protein VHX68_06885 [Planctomycetaceae bacterium]|jgi:hypothetical protein|nr:hypothetical protein [Planctomycetaceae bacterium]
MDAESLATWRRACALPFVQQLISQGQIVGTREVPAKECAGFGLPPRVAGVLEHARIPFISYPYEWSFAMLRDAALLHLRLLTESIRAGLILKDASPYNVQFSGKQSVFIDIGSFTVHSPGEPWLAYRQFCELMLFPLLLQAYRGVHFQPILRGELEGISARQFLQWLRWRDVFRPGVFTHGLLQAKLEQQTQALSTSTVRDLKISGFTTSLIERLLQKLTRLVERLQWSPPRTQWTTYDNSLPHVAEDRQAKSTFVRKVCHLRPRDLVWDLGCNDGRYSLIAGERATTVVAMDQDHACIDQLYRSADSANVLPLCMDLANPSPAMGWRGRERKRIENRGQPQLILCLGLIHHLVIAANIPLAEVVDWLASFRAEVILEFPSKNDPMVQALLRNKRDQYDDYSRESLEAELRRDFDLRLTESLPSGERTLYHAVPARSSTGA